MNIIKYTKNSTVFIDVYIAIKNNQKIIYKSQNKIEDTKNDGEIVNSEITKPKEYSKDKKKEDINSAIELIQSKLSNYVDEINSGVIPNFTRKMLKNME